LIECELGLVHLAYSVIDLNRTSRNRKGMEDE
jgi:hypothetical protein